MPPVVAERAVARIVADRFFTGPGVLVEVGAARPDYLSVSAHFRMLAWRVIAIEPIPEFCELQRQAGNEVLQYACSEVDQDDVDFVVVDSHKSAYADGTVSFESFSSLSIKPGYSALTSGQGTHTIKVKTRRLDTILKEHAPDIRAIDVLSIDVEGWELEVLRGLDLDRYRPKVMVIENFLSDRSYRQYARSNDYTLWRRLPPNEVYVATELLRGWERVAANSRETLLELPPSRWFRSVGRNVRKRLKALRAARSAA